MHNDAILMGVMKDIRATCKSELPDLNRGGCALFAFIMATEFEELTPVELESNDAYRDSHFALRDQEGNIFDGHNEFLLESEEYIFVRTLEIEELSYILITENWNPSFWHDFKDDIWDASDALREIIDNCKTYNEND